MVRVFIGIDFGTSITKVCFRYKDLSSIIYFDKSNKKSTIFYSEIYQDNLNKIYSPFNSRPENCLTIDYLKMRLARELMIDSFPAAFWLYKNTVLTLKQIAEFCKLDLNIIEKIDNDDPEIINPNSDYNPITNQCLTKLAIEEAEKNPNNILKGSFYMPFKKLNTEYNISLINLFFLANVIKETKQRIKKIISETNIDWYCTIGLPVSYYNSNFFNNIDHLFKQAMILSDKVIPNTQKELQNFYNEFKDKNLKNIKCQAYPEIAGAILSYYFSNYFNDGLHLYIDIGGGTLDAITFSFQKSSDKNTKGKVNLITGIVESLGIEALALETEENKSKIKELAYKIYKSQINKDDHYYKHDNIKTYNLYKESIHNIIRKLIILTNNKFPNFFKIMFENQKNSLGFFSPKASDEKINVFLGGGGANSKIYLEILESSYDDKTLYNFATAKFDFQKIPQINEGSDFNLEGKSFARFSIAYGLTFPPWERPDFYLPKEFSTNFNDNQLQLLDSVLDNAIPLQEDYHV